MDSITTPRRFIEVWQTSATLAEVASKLGTSKGACRARAWRYRQRGVPLKEFPPIELPVIDWGELADYAASCSRTRLAPLELKCPSTLGTRESKRRQP
jgi:hypothetical protein